MLILTPDNQSFDMHTMASQIDHLNYCVLDYSYSQKGHHYRKREDDPTDFYFIPLVFMEEFPRPGVELNIGGRYRITVPLDWSIVIADKNLGNLEILEIKHLNGRDFSAFVYQPITGFLPDFLEITIDNIYVDMSWTVPKLSSGHILALPLEPGHNKDCIFIVKDGKLPDSLDISRIFN